MRYLLVSIDNANAPDVAHVVSEFYLGYGVDDADVPGVHVRELAADVPAELERERTQNLALRHSPESMSNSARRRTSVRFPRWLNHLYAVMAGYFWLPCPRCGRMFGGHESWRDDRPLLYDLSTIGVATKVTCWECCPIGATFFGPDPSLAGWI